MKVLMVTIDIKPEFKERFMVEMEADAIGSNNDEPGCLRFDILQDSKDPNRIHLYEVYRDEAAVEVHRQARHYLKWRAAVKDWVAAPYTVAQCSNVYPSDDSWR